MHEAVQRVPVQWRETMKVIAFICSLLVLLISVPIGLYLQYHILKRVDASELMWFLFWVQVPITLFAQLAFKMMEKAK
jgi:hypothetical protein